MTREETVKVLSLLKAAYPSSYKDMNKQEANGVITIWATQFLNMPLDIVLIAINKLISKCKFPPSIAEVKESIEGLYVEAIAELKAFGWYMSDTEKSKYERIVSCCGCDKLKLNMHSIISGNGNLLTE